jgi:hypothetical protein
VKALGIVALLVVAAGTARATMSDGITIQATPLVARWPNWGTSLAGAVSTGAAGQPVVVQQKACGDRGFVVGATPSTAAGGAWSANVVTQGKTVFRAKWHGVISRDVVVLSRPYLVLGQIAQHEFRAILVIGSTVNDKVLRLQRFDSGGRTWKPVKTVRFGSDNQMTFRAAVPKGTTLRLMLPRAEARPCYLAGYSNLLRT